MKTLFATVCGLALVASASVHADHRTQKHDGYAAHGFHQGGHYRGHLKSQRSKHYNKHHRAHHKYYNKHARAHHKHYKKHARAHSKHYDKHYRGHKYSHAPRYGSRYGSRYYNAPRYRAGHHAYHRHNDGLTLLGGVLVGKLLHDSVHHDRHRAVAPSNSRHERQQRHTQRRDNMRDRKYVSPRHQRDERRR